VAVTSADGVNVPDPAEAADAITGPAGPADAAGPLVGPPPSSAGLAAPASATPDPAPVGPTDLGRVAVRGAAWMAGQTVGTRLVTLAGQLVLAWLLEPRHFGLISLAYTVTSFANLIQLGGVRSVLLHRHRRFDRWAGPAFWLTLALGLTAGLGILAAAPLAAWMYGSPRLIPLLAVLALVSPMDAMTTVPIARLQGQMRFRLLATLPLAVVTLNMAMTVALAAAGFGAMSFVLPQPITGATSLAAWWTLSGSPRPGRPRVRLSMMLLPKSVQALAGRALMTLTRQGDYFVLGLLTDPATVGVYYFAFSLSTQGYMLLTGNVTSVLTPALVSLHGNRKRQVAACLNTARVVALVGIPLCLIQAAAAEPAVRILFADKWLACVPVLQVLSLGMALRLVGDVGVSLFEAHGRFGSLMWINLVYAAVFLSAALACGAAFGMMGVAFAVAGLSGLLGPIRLYLAVKPGGGRAAEVTKVFATPLALAAGAVGPAYATAQLLPASRGYDWLRLVVIVAVALAIYTPLAMRFDRASVAELKRRAGGLRRRA
jgi:O-antigen/teichoic acid export membrane protein